MSFHDLEQHQHITNKIARNALKAVARKSGVPLGTVTQQFKDGDYDVTLEFWTVVEASYPGAFTRVDFCHTCRKFMLHA